MSQLQILTNNLGNFRLNVLSFSSPIFGSISGAQTRYMMQWYPIKANQPEVQFDVQFASELDYEKFQKFVRDSQTTSLNAPQPMVHLNWPERNINNWSGMITEFVAGGSRFNPAPRAQFIVSLVDSFVSKYTEISTPSAIFEKSFGFVMKGFTNLIPNPYQLRLPDYINLLPPLPPLQRPQAITPTTTNTNPVFNPTILPPQQGQ